MRSDIAKKLVERPRYGGSDKQKRSNQKRNNDPSNWENSPLKESCKKPNIIGYSGKYLNEYFAPLLRFLKKSVGRVWDDVNSELREHLSPRSVTQKHVLDHVYGGFVVLTPLWRGGVPYSMWGPLRKGTLYVDRKGFLRMVKKEPKRKPYVYPRSKRINDFEEYRELNGVWYWVKYKHLHAGESGYDVILRTSFTFTGLAFQGPAWLGGRIRALEEAHGTPTHGGEPIYGQVSRLAVEKRQLDKKTIQQEGLSKLHQNR